MADYGKVMRGLECCKVEGVACPEGCPYENEDGVWGCFQRLATDAYALIKAQREELRKLQRGRNWAPREAKGVKITVNVCPTERFTRGGKP